MKFWLSLTGAIALLIAAIAVSPYARAEVWTLSLELPTQNEDNSALPRSEINRVDFWCSGPTNIDIVLREPFLTPVVTADYDFPGSQFWTCYATVRANPEEWSSHSNDFSFTSGLENPQTVSESPGALTITLRTNP